MSLMKQLNTFQRMISYYIALALFTMKPVMDMNVIFYMLEFWGVFSILEWKEDDYHVYRVFWFQLSFIFSGTIWRVLILQEEDRETLRVLEIRRRAVGSQKICLGCSKNRIDGLVGCWFRDRCKRNR